ncbi:alpha-L-fucosidase [Paenibacillus aurantius]|uniref:alpha-L-fucosidase n=1 Tax=Paenibacillus aurantius TaxID=2918900 RepID=A0AA96REL5_9BACL|nr:alpha-L-fucosidase [Paenibacillus aurantius]WNQ10526.1 alpha-L-fucosidase [Paenibacillus aurantius]
MAANAEAAFIKAAARVAPSERQAAWQEMEFYAFIHYTVNTYTDREWGLGNEDPSLFAPTDLSADQWVEACKSAGMTGLILTCKHHDGFCLWPSAYTGHTVAASPWKDGRGDLVKEVAEACRRGGLRFGIYLSPWDRHEPTYGDSPAYNGFFLNQLRELLTGYGEIFCVWFDGACGEGPNGKRQVYDWEAYYRLIRELQPQAVISVCGPDVRWCGNEAGHTRPSEWSVVPGHLRDNEKIQEQSQQADDGRFAARIRTDDRDLGSRDVIRPFADDLVWYPAEVNTSIRPGWFYHASEDDKVKSLEELLAVYYGAVGGNATFLLNLPPDKRGRIHENDAVRLKELGEALRSAFRTNLAAEAAMEASETKDEENRASHVLDGRRETFWCPKEGTERASIELDLGEPQTFSRVVLMEHLRSGQRVESFLLEGRTEDDWKEIYRGTVIGYKKIAVFPPVTFRYLRITILESRWCPTLSFLGVYGPEGENGKAGDNGALCPPGKKDIP